MLRESRGEEREVVLADELPFASKTKALVKMAVPRDEPRVPILHKKRDARDVLENRVVAALHRDGADEFFAERSGAEVFASGGHARVRFPTSDVREILGRERLVTARIHSQFKAS